MKLLAPKNSADSRHRRECEGLYGVDRVLEVGMTHGGQFQGMSTYLCI
jgi:hypothetical protein